MAKAKYRQIDKYTKYYGEIIPLKGIWATGKTLKECETNLIEALTDWVTFRIEIGLPLPRIKR